MKPEPCIRTVTFDVGGTLIRPWPSVGHIYAETAARHGLKEIPPEALNRQFSAAWRRLKNFHHGRDEWAALVDETFVGFAKRPPSETFFPELYERFAEPGAWRIYDDVTPALDALASRGIGLGIISNWDERLRPLLDGLGLSKYFEAIIVSCDVGFPKPSPVIFEHAAKKLGAAAESILHAGDSREHDFEGATAAGFHAVLLERGEKTSKLGRIQSLSELERMVADG